VGDAHAEDFFQVDQGSICVERERRAEDLSEDAHIDLQYVFKDGQDKSHLKYVHQVSDAKCQ
jgi:hypothetical protein